MFFPESNQRAFDNFNGVLKFFQLLNSEVDISKNAPDCAIATKNSGLIAGGNLQHMCQLVKDKLGIKLIPNGCVQQHFGYLMTFEKGYLEEAKPEQRFELNKKSKKELLAIAKEKELSVSNANSKEEIVIALISA